MGTANTARKGENPRGSGTFLSSQAYVSHCWADVTVMVGTDLLLHGCAVANSEAVLMCTAGTAYRGMG